MNVLVTGGSGNIGTKVVADLLAHGHDVRVLDVKSPAERKVDFVKGSVTDPGIVTDAVKDIDAIVHLAAVPSYKPDIPGVDYMNVNVTGTFNVLEAAGRGGAGTVVMASSDSALGFVFCTNPFPPDYFPIDEAHPLKPQDPYGLSKLLGEELCKSATRKYGVKTICLRFCWVWFESTYAGRERLIADNPAHLPRTMWGYVDVRDVAQACRLAIEQDGGQPHNAFFITAADTYMDTPSIELIVGNYPDVRRIDDAYLAESHKSLFDISKARDILGYEPRHNWRSNV